MVQAGNSGLCGGSVPLADEVILLTGKMDKVIAFDEVSTLSAAYYKLLNLLPLMHLLGYVNMDFC